MRAFFLADDELVTSRQGHTDGALEFALPEAGVVSSGTRQDVLKHCFESSGLMVLRRRRWNRLRLAGRLSRAGH